MIARNSKWPFGGRITAIHTPSFKCVVSTNKEGVLKSLSTMIIEGDTMDGKANTRPCGKLIYSSALRKEDIQNLHASICQAIDEGGESGSSLGETLEEVFMVLREKGLVSEAINLANGTAGGLPVNWKQTLRSCNFFMARRGIAYVFRLADQQAEAEGNQYIVKKELAEAWNQFSANPCYDTAVRFVIVSPNMLPYFDGSFQKSQYFAIRTATTFRFENYGLPERITDIKELRELSQQEYAFFPRQFKGEVIYNAAPINFMGREWKFMVSSVQERIYKWAASLELGRDEDYDSISNEVIEYCIRWLGATTEEKQGYLFWDTSDGNVILQLTNMDDWFDISIFVTSREIRSLNKLGRKGDVGSKTI